MAFPTTFLLGILILITQCVGSEGKKCAVTSPQNLLTYSGNITSPNYPFKHPKNQHCEWILKKFDESKILQIVIYDAALLAGWLGPLHYLTLPDGEQFASNHRNVCRVFGVNETLQTCSKQIRDRLSGCSYSRLSGAEIPPTIQFDSAVHWKRRGFALGFKIMDCQMFSVEPRTPSTTAPYLSEETYLNASLSANAEEEFDKKAYIIVPVTLGVFVLIVISTVVLKIIVLSRNNRKDRSYTAASEANVYESPIVKDDNHDYDTIRSRPDLKRADLASYLSHRELVQYPRGRARSILDRASSATEETTTSTLHDIDGYVDMTGSVSVPDGALYESLAETPYLTMK